MSEQANTTDIEPAKPSQKAVIVKLVESKRVELLQLLPSHMRSPEGVDRLIRVTTSCILANPQLRDCTPASLITGIVQAAQLGLEPTGQYGGAYLVPFKNNGQLEATMIPDYRGLIEIVRRTGQLKSIGAWVIHEEDEFDYCEGFDLPKHKRAWNQPRGEITGVWAAARLKDGGEQFVVMDRNEVDAIKAISKGAKSNFSPWNTPVGYPEMMKKTALRRLCKLLPRSVEFRDATEIIDRADPIDTTPQQTRGGLLSLAAHLGPDEDEVRQLELSEAVRSKWTDANTLIAEQIDAIRKAGGTPAIGEGGKPNLAALPVDVLTKILES